jgi:hypothetical protein
MKEDMEAVHYILCVFEILIQNTWNKQASKQASEQASIQMKRKSVFYF